MPHQPRHLPVLNGPIDVRLDQLQQQGQEVAEKVKAAAKRLGATCKTDCYGCCYQLVATSVPEALMIARWLNENDRITPALVERLKENAFLQYEREEHFAQAIPCVFLDESTPDRHCTIYPVRPFGCATYWTCVEDPADCYPAAGLKDVPTVDTREIALRWLVETGRFSQEFLGADPDTLLMPIPLPLALMVALDVITRGPEAVNDWLAKSDEDAARIAHMMGIDLDKTESG